MKALSVVRLAAVSTALAVLTGCPTKPAKDPNDPAQMGLLQPEVLMKNLRAASDAANRRVARGELTVVQAKAIVSQCARELTQHITIQKIPENRAWEYAEVFRTAQMWDRAKAAFEQALEHPRTEDRRVNDSLRLAHVLAELGEVPRAIAMARSVFDVPSQGRAPIMPALIFEIVPAAEGKGYDLELARLLEDAIPIYDATTVDESTTPGKEFVIAKPFHIAGARRMIVRLTGKR